MSPPKLSTPSRPRLGLYGVERLRAQAWFDASADSAVRIVYGPIGSGKTYAVRQFIERSAGEAVYVRVIPRSDATWLRTAIEASPPHSTVVLDELDRADPDAYTALFDAILAGEVRRKLVLVARSRRRLRAEVLIARGIARACGAEELWFDSNELEQLAALHRVKHDAADVAQLLHDTEGWAIAADWLVRDAAESGRRLSDAFSQWRERNGHLLLEFIESEGSNDAAAFHSFRDSLGQAWTNAQEEAERLEQLGLPIVRTRTGLRPCRILARLAVPATSSVPDPPTTVLQALMTVTVFGRFRCELAGRPVNFSRRRDQQVFAYVAVAPDCRVSRDALADAFWPGINRTVAAQGVRTTLSRIRRAIADTLPSIDAERYFETASGDVRINVRAVAVDAQRFVDHVEQGRIDDARGAIDGAKHHYRVAQKIYADRVLASEAPEPCFERRAAYFEALYVEALARITELHAATGDVEIARGAARVLLACNTEDARRRALRGFSGPAASA